MLANLFTIKVPSGQDFFADAELVTKFVEIIEQKSSVEGRSYSGIEVSGDKIKRLDIFNSTNVSYNEEVFAKSEAFRDSLKSKGYEFAFLTGEVSESVAADTSFFGTFTELTFENGKLVTVLK